MGENKQRRIGDYILIEKIGKGGQATVWKGTDLKGDFVAIKKMSIGSNIENKKSYEREVAILKLVQHEYLVKNLACFQEGLYYYLVYEYCPCDLLQFLQRQPTNRFPEPVVKKWIKQLTSVMLKLNSLKIIHRDLKPENILLTEESMQADIRLADFGLAKQGLTTLSFVGTLEYASPEIKNCQDYSYNTDVWSLGVIAFAALFGKLPILHEKVLIFPNDNVVSHAAREFLQYCLTFDYKIRPNFQQVLDHDFLKDLPVPAEPFIIVEQGPAPKVRNPENMHKYITKIITMSDDMLSHFESANRLEFLIFYIAKHFTEKFQEIINYIFESNHQSDFDIEFMEYFFNQSERACNTFNSLENKYREQTDDEKSVYTMQIDEYIEGGRGQIPNAYLKILGKINKSIGLS